MKQRPRGFRDRSIRIFSGRVYARTLSSAEGNPLKDAKPVRKRATARANVTKLDNAAETGNLPDKPQRKQAVVIIHGMGEQRPMSTIRGFVDAVWTRDLSLTKPFRGRIPDPDDAQGFINQSWITPDRLAASHELRRITTPYDVNDRRTDFFELYWADLTHGTTRGRLFAWVRELLWRKRADIPDDAMRLYWATWVFVVVVALSAALLGLSVWRDWVGPVTGLVLLAAASAVLWVLDNFVLPYFGDVAAYTRATPATIRSRKEVRERGLALLRTLNDSDRYDRVVVVAHSLGTIIAYDLLQILWAERRPRGLEWPRDRKITDAIRAVEAHAILPGQLPGAMDAAALAALRDAQWKLYRELRSARAATSRWKISDFVTVGSPLTHADFLLAHNIEALRRGTRERLFAISPPLSESATVPKLLYYEKKKIRAVHHAAVFAATRWTNIFDIGNRLSTGDPISGRLAENFGPGIAEFQVEMKHPRWGRLFTHTYYWSGAVEGREIGSSPGNRTHVGLLRRAVDLARAAGD